MRSITVDSRVIAYHEHGAGEAVVLLHPGFVANGMQPLLGQAALSAYRLIAPHRRGYGCSDPAEPPVSMADLAADVVGLLDGLEIERAHLVGHSLGGCVALEVARTRPERVRRLVLLEPPLGFALSQPTLAVLLSTAGEAMARFAAGDHEGAVAVWLDGAFGPGWQEPLEEVVGGAVAQATKDAAAAFGLEVPALQTWPFGPPDLAAISAPMLSVAHEDAWAGFVEVHQALLAAGAEAALLPIRSHLLQVLEPATVAGCIGAFVER
jgi:pimeloyl-ACP methyl ester carboxylesterase